MAEHPVAWISAAGLKYLADAQACNVMSGVIVSGKRSAVDAIPLCRLDTIAPLIEQLSAERAHWLKLKTRSPTAYEETVDQLLAIFKGEGNG